MAKSASVSIVFALLFTSFARADSTVNVSTTAKLIGNAQIDVVDARGWAIDLHDVLNLHDLPQTRENVCAVIAIIDQESSFRADPPVAGLGKISEQVLRKKLDKIPLGGAMAVKWLENNPTPQASFLARIRNAKTERDLDLAYRSLVNFASDAASIDAVVRIGLLNSLIEDKNEIDTAGSMQVSVKFSLDMARQRRWLPMTLDDIYGVRDQLYTRHGGMYYGVKQLLGYDTGYNQKIFRFADFNAGRFASRNAAFQEAIAKLLGVTLSLDGDLLRYSKNGVALKSITSSETALRKLNSKLRWGLTDSEIRKDLLREKQQDFTFTRTFTSVRESYAATTKAKAVFARLPDIALSGPKLSRDFSTKRFAQSVNVRYQACMKVR